MKKRTAIWILLNLGVVVFIIMSITVWYLFPVLEEGSSWIEDVVRQLINLFR